MVQLISLILGAIYLVGIVKFLRGFRRTNFSRSLPTKITLAVLWPVLLVVNSSYRKNFQKALKG